MHPVVGDSAPIAALPGAHTTIHEDLFRWLGVAEQPRPADVITRCGEMASGPFWHRAGARAVIEHLSRRLTLDPERTKADYVDLKDIGWLPAESDTTRGHRPNELFATFRRHLFVSQASFLDLPLPVQQDASEVLAWLGVGSEPSASQVVAHLLWCSHRGVNVTKAIWRFLNDNAADPALDALIGKRCLLVDDAGTYVDADEVFWAQHPFGRWRFTLGPEFRKWQALLDRLGIAERPKAYAAITVLQDIAARHGGEQAPLLQDDVPVVQACWRMLSAGLSGGEISPDALSELRTYEVVLDTRQWLRKPPDVFFRDSPRLADLFEQTLRPRLIERPEGLWPALATAGVRNLSDAVETHVVEVEGGGLDGEISDRLRERRRLLLRALGGNTISGQLLDDFFQTVEVRHLTRLRIQQTLEVGDEEYRSEPYERAALFLPDRSSFLCVDRPGSPPVWVEVAREFIRGLRLQHGEPSVLASAVKVVLEAPTATAASAELDELGFAALDVDAAEGAPGRVVGSFGGTSDGDEAETVGDHLRQDAHQPADQADGGVAETSAVGHPTPDERGAAAVADPGGPSAGVRSSRVSGVGGEPGAPSGTATRRSQPASAQRRLRSYVAPAGPSPNSPGSAGEADEEVERAGVAAVIAYEQEHGRKPTEMPSNHPGFDVESVDPHGASRLIEIKATADRWGERGVALSAAQFTTAQQQRERFWLYVVETALTNPRVHTINDPVSKADQFFFDDGWRQAADAETVPRPSGFEPLPLLDHPPAHPGAIPFFEAGNPDAGQAAAADGWLVWPGRIPHDDCFAVRIAGHGLGIAFAGGAALVEPAEGLPEDDDLVLARLHDQHDPDTGSPVTIRRWAPERDLEGRQLALRLGSDGSVEPLTVELPERIAVIGVVRQKYRSTDFTD